MTLRKQIFPMALMLTLLASSLPVSAQSTLNLPPMEPLVEPPQTQQEQQAQQQQQAGAPLVTSPVNPMPSAQSPSVNHSSLPQTDAPNLVPSTASSTLKVGTSAKTVPMGTNLQVVFNTAMDSRITTMGEPFSAFIAEDFTSTSNGIQHVVLPAGSMVRGRVEQVKRPGFFSRGGMVDLAFDHVVLPNGELMPLDLKLSTTQNTVVNRKGNLYSDPGIQAKVQDGFQDGVGVFNNIREKGVQAGQNIGDGLGQIVTVPAAIIGGTVAGAGVTAGKAAVAVVGKGESVIVNPGDSVSIDFGGSFTLPSD